MALTVLVHILSEDAVVGEIEELPDPTAQYLLIRSPRLRDGRDVTYLLPETNIVIYPWHRVMSIEVLTTEGEDKIVTFIRE